MFIALLMISTWTVQGAGKDAEVTVGLAAVFAGGAHHHSGHDAGSGNTLHYKVPGTHDTYAGQCSKFYGGACPGMKQRAAGMNQMMCCVSYNAASEWNPGYCESTPGVKASSEGREQLGGGLSKDTCDRECKKQPYSACEFHSGNGACFRLQSKVTAANYNSDKGQHCYIRAKNEDDSAMLENFKCTKNVDCANKFGDVYNYCSVKSHRADLRRSKSGTICARRADCCKKLNSVEGKCPTKCFTTMSGSQYYAPTGMNTFLGARPRGEGATSYAIQTAMSRCNSKGDCSGITCNVNNQGWDRCELRRHSNPGVSSAADCKSCLSYKKASTAGLCTLEAKGSAPKGCIQKENKRFQFPSSTLLRDCERKCIGDAECDTFVTDTLGKSCFLYNCYKTYAETTNYAHYNTYRCFDIESVALQQDTWAGADWALKAFGFVGFGTVVYGAICHYSNPKTDGMMQIA